MSWDVWKLKLAMTTPLGKLYTYKIICLIFIKIFSLCNWLINCSPCCGIWDSPSKHWYRIFGFGDSSCLAKNDKIESNCFGTLKYSRFEIEDKAFRRRFSSTSDRRRRMAGKIPRISSPRYFSKSWAETKLALIFTWTLNNIFLGN